MTEEIQSGDTLVTTQKVIVTIPFIVQLAAGTNETLVSSPISVYYQIKKIEVHFSNDTANLMQVSVFVSNNRSAPTNVAPPDTNLISELSPTPYVIGESEIVSLPMTYTPAAGEMFLKAFFSNLATWQISCMVTVTIEAQLQIPVKSGETQYTTPELQQLSGKYQSQLLAKARALLDISIDTSKGTPTLTGSSLGLAAILAESQKNGWYTKYAEVATATTFTPVSMPLFDRVKTIRAWLDSATSLSYDIFSKGQLLKIATAGLNAQTVDAKAWLESVFGVDAKAKELYMASINAAFDKPLQYYWNSQYVPEIPTSEELFQMNLKEIITLADLHKFNAAHGFDEDTTNKLLALHFPDPSEGELLELLKRGHIEYEQYSHFMQRKGYRTEWIDQLQNLRFVVPDVNTSIRLLLHRQIDYATYKLQAIHSGVGDALSDMIYASHYPLPDVNTVIRSIRRGIIPQERIEMYLLAADLDPTYNDSLWKPLLEEVPQIGDLINMRVKEVIDQQTFSNTAKFYGFNELWTTRIWDAHFMPATWTDFLTAMRRRLTVNIPHAEGAATTHTFGADVGKDLSIIKELSKLVDYDERYYDFFQTRIYNDPSPRMSQWAYESGVINEDILREIVHRYGYTPDVETWFGGMLVHFQERAWINRYITTLASAYVSGAINEATLRERITAQGRSSGVADLIVKIGNTRKEMLTSKTELIKPKLLGIGELKKAYLIGKVNESQLMTEFQLRGYQVNEIQIVIDVLNSQLEVSDAGGKKTGLTTSELFEALRYGTLTEDAVRTELMLKGMQLNDINTLISTKLMLWSSGGKTVTG